MILFQFCKQGLGSPEGGGERDPGGEGMIPEVLILHSMLFAPRGPWEGADVQWRPIWEKTQQKF